MKYPSPWMLNGQGIILTHRFKKSWIINNGCIPEHLQCQFMGGLSFTMLVNYTESNCGPYRDLLFIPGLFLINKRYHFMITKIFVDTAASMSSGKLNWGIPKELAEINWSETGSTITFNAQLDQQVLFNAEVKTNPIYFPITSRLSPFKIYQEMNENSYVFKPHGNGQGAICKLKTHNSNSNHFPRLNEGKLISCLNIKKFKLDFPESKIKGL